MASTTFTSGTIVTKEWLNDVNKLTYGDSATITNSSSFWPDVSSDVQMHRMAGRLFVYDGATFTGNFSGTQSGFIPTSTEGANWAPRDSALFVSSKRGLMAITGFASNQNMPTGAPTETIGVSGFAIGKQTGKSVWGLYSDVQFESGTSGYGVEFAVKNKSGVDQTATPYYEVGGAVGIWLPAGGDASYGGAPNAPNNWGIAFGSSSSTGQTWNRGIVFFKNSITGTDGTTGTGIAIEMAKGHTISWRAPGNYAGFNIRSDVNAANSNVSLVALNNAIYMTGTGSGNIVQFGHQTNGVNYLQIFNGANGSPVTLQAAIGGTDTNLDIRFVTQGSGVLRFGTWTSNADAPVNGYITIKDGSGTTRKLATIA